MEIPGAPQKKPIAIVGATVHPVSDAAIENGTVVFEEGRLTAIGADVTIPEGAKIIKAARKGNGWWSR